MRLVNVTGNPLYCKTAGCTLDPCEKSRELRLLEDWVKSMESSTRGFRILLSDSDLNCIDRLLSSSRSAMEAVDSARAAGVEPRYPGVELESWERVKERVRAEKNARFDAASALKRASDERVAAIVAESNMLDDKGVPVNDKASVGQVARGVEPELHPEMSSDVDSVFANNLAILRAQGKSVVVAGETKVSHDPSDYRGAPRP